MTASPSFARNIRDHFPGWVAQTPLGMQDAGVARGRARDEELARSASQIYTNVAGKPLDEPEFEPFFDGDGKERQADLAASVARREFPGLSRARRSRNTKSGGRSAGPTRPPRRCRGWCSPRSWTSIPNLKIILHHFGAHRADAGRPHRPGLGPARRAHLGRGLRRAAQEPEEAAARLFQARASTPTPRPSPAGRRCDAVSPSIRTTRSCSRRTARSIRRRARCTSARRIEDLDEIDMLEGEARRDQPRQFGADRRQDVQAVRWQRIRSSPRKRGSRAATGRARYPAIPAYAANAA